MTTHGIYAIHGDHNLSYPGYVVLTFGIGHDPNHRDGHDFTQYANTPIARLNNGYGNQGTIPLPEHYPAFAQRCARFVAASRGCSRWIIGNEPNHSQEQKDDQPITPAMYARCYELCHAAIHAQPGHEDDEVLVAAIAPWNAETGPWMDYFDDVQSLIDGCDGFALHTYTRAQTPDAVVSDDRMGAPFSDYHNGFRAYRDWMNAIWVDLRGLPCYITEFCVAGVPWDNANTECIQAAYAEIDAWNQRYPERPIRCLAVYRWAIDRWSFHDKPAVIADFMRAVDRGYTLPVEVGPTEPEPPEDALDALTERVDELEAELHQQAAVIKALYARVQAGAVGLAGGA